MASSFSEILKIAKAHSEDTKREALEVARRREAALRQAREEQDKKERAEKELQKKLALKRAEEAKKEEERRKQREEELARRREEIAKKKEGAKEEARTARGGRSDNAAPRSKYINTSSTALTREEKRMAKDPLFKEELGKGKGKAAALQKLKNGRLPGGALPIVENGASSSKTVAGSRGSNQPTNARARLAALPPTLTKLNADKRDQKSVDELSRDLKRGKLDGPPTSETKSAISGSQTSSYDWFGKKDKGLDSSNKNPKAGNSNQAIGVSSGKMKQSNNEQLASSSRPSASRKPTTSGSFSKGGPGSLKRSRSTELDDSDSEDSDDRYYHEKRSKRPMTHRGGDDDELQGDMRELIWGLMGKKRSQYTSMDVESDDDMEATGFELEREEMRSSRIARKEDAEAEAEEKQRELEKKRKKMEQLKSR